MAEKPCTILVHFEKKEPPAVQDLKKTLENGSREDKVDALKQVIRLMANGESLSQLLVPIIRGVIPMDDHELKKLFLLYLELVEKTTADGKLLHEMILVW